MQNLEIVMTVFFCLCQTDGTLYVKFFTYLHPHLKSQLNQTLLNLEISTQQVLLWYVLMIHTLCL